MKIAVGSDHAGFDEPKPYYKPEIIKHIQGLGHEVIDCGTDGPESVDYPDFADKVADVVLNGHADCGVLVCGTGIGIGMAANRHRGIRAATCATPEMATLAREHNDANVIAIGARQHTVAEAIGFIDRFIATPFSGEERHVRRIAQLAAFETDGTLEPDPRAAQQAAADVPHGGESSDALDPEAG